MSRNDIERQKDHLWEAYDMGLLSLEEVEAAIEDINYRAVYYPIEEEV